MRSFVFSLAFVLFASPALHAQKSVDDSKAIALFDSYIQQSMPNWKVPGLSIVVVKNGNVVFRKAYGVRELGNPEPYTTSTLSTCASTTKAMTAVCMGMLVDEGKVKWSDRVSDLLPGFKLSDPYSSAEITVHDLFTHNSGLGNADNLWVFGYSRNEIIKRMKEIPPAYSFRSSYIYQNLMYIVAGEVIHKISGKTWDEFITERLFKPIGMNHSFADHSLIPAGDNTTTPHFKDRARGDSVRAISYYHGDNIGAAGGVWSCADDMDKWLQCLLDSTRIHETRLLKPETFTTIFQPKIVIPGLMYPTMQLLKPHWQTYGLGWFQHDYRGRMVQFHTGSLDGLVAITGLMPDEKSGVYVFGNLDHAELRHALLYKAFDLWNFHDNNNDWSNDFLNLYKGLQDTAIKKENELLAKRVLHTKPSLPLAAYTGKYTNTLAGEAEVVLTNDMLTVKLPNHISLTLDHWHYDVFYGTWSYWWFDKSWIQFSLNKEGKVTSLSIDGEVYVR